MRRPSTPTTNTGVPATLAVSHARCTGAPVHSGADHMKIRRREFAISLVACVTRDPVVGTATR
jgi:hypothetical protein